MALNTSCLILKSITQLCLSNSKTPTVAQMDKHKNSYCCHQDFWKGISSYFYGRGFLLSPDGNSNYVLSCAQSQGVPNILYWCLVSGAPPRSEELAINQILKYSFIYTVWNAATRRQFSLVFVAMCQFLNLYFKQTQ